MSTKNYRENSIERIPSSNFLHELILQNYGLTPTGDEDPPRKKYCYSLGKGCYHIAYFFEINPSNLSIKENTIWLTTLTIEDFLIFQAFNFDLFHFVISVENEDGNTLYGFNVMNEETITFLHQSQATLYVNPKLLNEVNNGQTIP